MYEFIDETFKIVFIDHINVCCKAAHFCLILREDLKLFIDILAPILTLDKITMFSNWFKI